MSAPLAHIRAALEEHGLKITPQRMVVTEYLMGTKDHPTADEVFQAVSDRLPAISKATIYNTLNCLVTAGVVREVSTEPGKTRYDANLESHHHFVDTETGKIYDIPWQQVTELCESLGGEYKISDYQITFFGQYRPT